VLSLAIHDWHGTLAAVNSLIEWLDAPNGPFPLQTMEPLPA